MRRRVQELEVCGLVAFGWIEDGIPTFHFRQAPPGLSTRRQLAARGKRPAGQDPVAQIKWKRGKRFALLFRDDLAADKRAPTPAVRRSLEKALAARRYCRTGGHYVDHYVRGPKRQCGDCYMADPEV